MSVEVVMESPLAHALNSAIQPKLVEVGWSTGGGDESALSEYIILMLVNGKTQEQIAAELSGDLLNLGPDDPGARDFSRWLFEQVDVLSSQSGGNGDTGAQGDTADVGQDADMGDNSDAGSTNVYAISSVDLSPDLPDLRLPLKPPKLTSRRPTGPKSMRNGGSNRPRDPRDRRMLGHLAKAMDRSTDAALHRRTQGGNDRISTHRAPPTGPRGQTQIRGTSRMMNNRMNGGMPNTMNSQGPGAAALMNMNPQQQAEMMAIFEQQSRFMAQMFNPEQQQQMMMGMGMGGHINPAFAQQQSGKSLFDRVQPQRPQNGFRKDTAAKHQAQNSSSSMDVEMSSQETPQKPELSPDTICKYQLKCTNKDCIFAHQSPAAKPGAHIDITDTCSYGAACKNFKCTGRHPSPAQRIAHAEANAAETECKFYPYCTNPRCPFMHPSTTMPACRNGADCSTPNCKFAHSKIVCKFDPCTNPQCPYKHPEGHKRGKFEDKVWTAGNKKEHVSERKFVDDDGAEELIVPGSEGGISQASTATAELIT